MEFSNIDNNILNIVMISSNIKYAEIIKLNTHYKNYNITYFKSIDSYMNTFEKNSCDLIVLYSEELYNEKKLEELKNIAFEISNIKNKKISIGYSYKMPPEEILYKSIDNQIEIISFKNSTEYIEKAYPTPFFTHYDLIELTLATIDNFNISKQYKLTKNKTTL